MNMYLIKPPALAILATVMLLGGVKDGCALEVGKPAPPLELTMMDGSIFNTANARGEVVVVNLWATWCTFCRDEMPALEAFYQRHRKEGLKVIAVSMDEPTADAEVKEVLKAFTFQGAIGRSSKLKPLGRIWRLPMTFVIDRNGVLRRDGSEGEPKVDLMVLEKQVTPLLKTNETVPAY
jgi:thiol-disulfide isomerase/thioredoxin